MSRSLLHLVLRHADGLAVGPGSESDADLLHRFVRARDEPAFGELLRRHGPMVWAVCRHLLPDAADAEDAFQATFLALVRSASAIRRADAVAGWLHGVAVRVATRLKRSAVRRRQREQKAAGPEADRPVPDATWDALLAAVHEEVQRLPDPLRAAFVLCDLEGVRQPDAAARLGWKAGTLTGRLARARQVLLERLAGRGLAPAVAGGTVGLGVATAAAAVPAALTDKLMRLTAAGGAVPPAVLELLREVTPMVLTRTKLVAAALVVAGGLGTVMYTAAVAQQPGEGGGGSGYSSGEFFGGGPPGSGGAPGAAPAGGRGAPGTAPPGAGGPTMPGAMGGGMARASVARAEWEHELVEQPNTVSGLKKVLDTRGKDGWEFAGAVSFGNPSNTQLVFKRPKGGARAGGMAMGGMMMGPMGVPGGGPPMGGFPGLPGAAGPMGATGGGSSAWGTPPTDPFGGRGGGGGRGGSSAGSGGGSGNKADGRAQIHVIALKNAEATTLARVLEKVFAKAATITPDPRTNSLIVDATEATMVEVTKLVDRLDGPEDGGRPPGAGRPGPGGPPGFGPPMGGGPPAGRP